MAKKKASGTNGSTADAAESAKILAEHAAKFKKSAGVRVARALKALDAIAPLGNRKRFSYTADQAQKIIDALDAKLESVTKAFDPNAATAAKVFEV